MTGKFLLAVLLTLSLVGQIFGQSGTGAVPSSGAVAPSSGAVAPSSGAVAPSSVVVAPSSGAVAPSSVAVAPSSVVVAPSASSVVPAAPVNLINQWTYYYGCPLRQDNTNHQTYLCVSWEDPTDTSFVWEVTISPSPSTGVNTFSTDVPYVKIIGLTPDTQYTISVIGINAVGTQSVATVGTGALYRTSPTDAKTNPTAKDLQNVSCQNGTSLTTFRKVINCQWGLPPTPNPAPFRIDIKARCISLLFKNKVIRRSLIGTATSVVLPINRAEYTCNIAIFGIYPLQHIAVNSHGHKFVRYCDSATAAPGCVSLTNP